MPRKNVPGSGDVDIRQVPAADLSEMEHLAIEKANRCISAIENALAVWELSKDKPQDLAERIGRLRTFHEALTDWERKALRTLGKGGEMGMRVRRLKEFTDICYRYT